MACAVISSFAKTGSPAASPMVETRFPWFVCHASERKMVSVAKCILLCWEPPNLLGNLQYRLQDARLPTLGDRQHEGKSAHILRSSRADTFSITSGQVRRMLPKLLLPTFCSDS